MRKAVSSVKIDIDSIFMFGAHKSVRIFVQVK